MNNEVLKAFIAEYGNRICWLQLNNNYKIYIGYKSSNIQDISEIKFKTVKGVDFYGLPQRTEAMKEEGINETVYTTWHLTELIETFCVMEEKYADYRLDPFMMT